MYGVRLPSSFQQLVKGHVGPVYTVKFNSGGEYAMSGSEDRGVCLYNPHKNIMIKNYKNLHNYDVSGLEISRDNSKFVTGGGDKNIIVTDVAEGKTINKYCGHNGRVNSVAFNSDDKVIVSGSYDTTVRCWDVRANAYTPIDIIKGFKDSVSHVQVRGFEIVAASMDGTVRFYDVRSGQFINDEIGEGIQSFCLAQSNRAYIASAVDNNIYLIEKKSGNKVMEYTGHQAKNYTVNCKFTQEDSHVLTGSTEGKLFIYDLMKPQAVCSISVSNKALSGMDVYEHMAIVGSHDGHLYFSKY